MNTQKGFIVPLVIIIVLAFIAGGVYYFSQNSRVKGDISVADQTAITNCKTVIGTDWNNGFRCILDVGKKISDAKACNILSDASKAKYTGEQKDSQDLVAICKVGFAAQQKDASVCLSIQSSSEKMTTATRNSCLIKVANLTKDNKICNNISTDTERNICVAGTRSGVEQCRTYTNDDMKYSCFITLARKDAAICNNIDFGKDPKANKEGCILVSATAMKDWRVCNNITTTVSRDYCVRQVIYVNNLDPNLCSNAGTLKNSCLELMNKK